MKRATINLKYYFEPCFTFINGAISEKHIFFVYFYSGAPEPVIFKEPVVTSASITVSWVPPTSEETISGYEISYTLNGRTTTKRVTETMIKLTGLAPGTTVVFSVRPFSNGGQGGAVISLTVSTLDISKCLIHMPLPRYILTYLHTYIHMCMDSYKHTHTIPMGCDQKSSVSFTVSCKAK